MFRRSISWWLSCPTTWIELKYRTWALPPLLPYKEVLNLAAANDTHVRYALRSTERVRNVNRQTVDTRHPAAGLCVQAALDPSVHGRGVVVIIPL